MKSIEALNLALVNYPGTLLFISHDREFVSSLATRIIEMTLAGIVDFTGTKSYFFICITDAGDDRVGVN